MAWIEVHQTLPSHRKVKRLKRLLKIKDAQAVGHLVMLWLWAIDNSDSGSLEGLDPEDIAEAAGWTGDAKTFQQALIQAGFVDEGDSLLIHDWQEYTGILIDKRNDYKIRNKQRQQRYRDRKKADEAASRNADVTHDDNSGVTLHNADVTRYDNVTHNVTVTSRNPYNQTKPNHTIPTNDDDDNKYNNTRNVTKSSSSPAVEAFQKLISPTPSTSSMRELLEFEKAMGSDVCLRAIDAALDADAKNWNYIRQILRNKQAAGVKSLADWDKLEAKRQDNRKPKGPTICETVETDQGYAVPKDLGDLDRLIAEGLV